MAKAHRACTLLLRFIAVVASVASCIIMVTGHQTVTSVAGSVEAKYTYMPALKYFVIANAVVSVYSFLVLFLPSGSLLWRSVVAMDLIFAILLASSVSAAASIHQVAKNGDSHVGWMAICEQVSKYCDHVTGALAAGIVAFAVYMILVLYAVHTVIDPLLLNKSREIGSSSFRL